MFWALSILASVWVGYALAGRRWRIEPRLDAPFHASVAGRVVAVVPARNEARELPHTLPSLLRQSHGDLQVVLVDDHSDDGTSAVAGRIADESGATDRLHVETAAPLEAGWTGKVWAQAQGVATARRLGAEWIWFTDADICHEREVLQRLLSTASGRRRDFVSVMARLRCATVFEKLLIPAFTYFFAGLYAFHRIGDDTAEAAGAAGGCMLVRADLLERAGGMAVIRDAVIDDVALGTACKRAGGHLWLGYDAGVRSTRGYESLAAIWSMVARSAYTQLGYQPLALLGCVAGLAYLFFVPIGVLVAGSGLAWWLALAAYLGMVRSYLPLVTYLGNHRAWALTLPLAGALYMAMTVTSAWRYHRGTGNHWKGRAYDTRHGGSPD